jgi:serine/threonine protein phosphatase 1
MGGVRRVDVSGRQKLSEQAAADLTQGGLLGWTLDDFPTLLRYRRRPDGSPALSPMDRLVRTSRHFTDVEIEASRVRSVRCPEARYGPPMGRLSYAGFPTAWRGSTVAELVYNEPVAVVGDVHGRSDLLRRLLDRVGERPIVVVGDLCDRGPDTRGVLDLLVGRRAVGVMGNHDLWLATWLAGEGFDRMALSSIMGGRATLASYGISVEHVADGWRNLPVTHVRFLLGLHVALDLCVQGERYWVVHGGIPENVSFEGREQDEIVPWLAEARVPDLMWRSNDPGAIPRVGRPIIMGHRPLLTPVDTGGVIAIDTGAGTLPDGALTAVLLPERTFLSVR